MRVLSSEACGLIVKVRRGLYSPIHPGKEPIKGRYWAHQSSTPQQELDKAAHKPQAPGRKSVLVYPEGVVREERWLSKDDFVRRESKRQRDAYFAAGLIAYEDDWDDDEKT